MGLPSNLYDREYFLSDLCEGLGQFEEGGLSPIKRVQVEMLDPQPGTRVLDAGCGRGELLRECAARGASVAGMDYSEAAVGIARETLAGDEGADIRQADVTDLPWPDDSFDAAMFGDVIEHLFEGQAAAALAELRRVLAPGGLLLVHTAPNRRFLDVGWPIARLVLKGTGKGEVVTRTDKWIADSKRYHVNEQTTASLRRSSDRGRLLLRQGLDRPERGPRGARPPPDR